MNALFKSQPRWVQHVVPPTLLIIAVVTVWYLLAVPRPSITLPTPLEVWQAAVDTREQLWDAIGFTMLETAVGLAISIVLGVVVAAAMDLSTFLRRALYPLLVASQTVQILAIAPLLVLWFGFGLVPKIIVVVLFCFFPMAVNTSDGLASADPEQIALLRSMGASRWQIWRMVRMPTALPSFFSGLRIAVTYSIVAATIGEWVGGTNGLGQYILRSKNALATDQVFVGMLVTTFLSIGLFVAVYLIERAVIPWYHTEERQWKESGIY